MGWIALILFFMWVDISTDLKEIRKGVTNNDNNKSR